MLGLPAEPGAVGAIMLALGVIAAIALVLFAREWIAAELGLPLRSAVSLATTATLATTLAAGPFVLWRVVEDIRVTSRLSTQQAEEIGANRYNLDERVLDRVRAVVPPDAAYVLEASPSVDERARLVLTKWVAFSLLPRVPVDLARADWVVTWGVPPSSLGVEVADQRVIASRDEQPDWYVARVVS